jgi:hypothetical protein
MSNGQAGGGTAGCRGDGEQRDAQQEAVLAPPALGEAAEEHQQRGVDDGVGVEHPGEVSQASLVQVPRDIGQGHVDDEQVEAGQDDPGAHDDQHQHRRGVLAPGGSLT